MLFKQLTSLIIILLIFSCSKKDEINYKQDERVSPFILYEEGMKSFEKRDYFFASKKFSEAELNFEQVELAAKSSLMASFCLYGINFYNEAIEGLQRYLNTYPADKNVIYAHYLLAIIQFELISDEKKDLKPLIEANKKIDFFLKKYPNSDYALDLRFKKDLIQNQLAAKELFIAKYYISTQKWAPAINRLKVIVKDYDKTIFIEEALHRLVEISYHLGLEKEAENYARILGYNYNSSEWYAQSYKVLNKDYNIDKEFSASIKDKKNENFLKKIINMIK